MKPLINGRDLLAGAKRYLTMGFEGHLLFGHFSSALP
jgi:hypothetical protein